MSRPLVFASTVARTGSGSVSICTFVPVKQISGGGASMSRPLIFASTVARTGSGSVSICQHLYFCTSKASKLSTDLLPKQVAAPTGSSCR